MPQILIKLLGHLQADDLGMAELAALIANDAGMTAKLLAVANSSAYHRNGRTVNLEQSLVSLGTDMIKTLVISDSVFQTFNSFPHSGSTDLRAFWKNALTTAVIARELAKSMQYVHHEEAYLAGLLHNVGRLALLATAPKEYAFNFTARDDEDLCAVEQRTLEITHTEAGAWLIERWQLDSFLADAVLYHHEPSARLAASHPLIRIVRMAHVLSAHSLDRELVEQAAALCGLDVDEAHVMLARATRQVEQSAQHLGIDLAGADDVPAPAAVAPVTLDPVQQRLADEVRNLVLVSEIGQSFARHTDQGDLLEAVTRSARILFDFENTCILLQNPTAHALVGIPTGTLQRIGQFSIPLQAGSLVADSALARKLACIRRDGQPLGLAEEQLFRILGSDSLVCLPLVIGRRCLGVLIGGVPSWQLPALQKRESFLQAYGAQAAIALDNALAERGHSRQQLAQVADDYREATRRVVHEVNNPLSIIKNYLSVLDHKLAQREPVTGEMSILNEEIDRVGQLISGLADLKPNPDAPRTADLASVTEEVLRLFRATAFIPDNVEVLVDLHEPARRIDGDPDVLKQILVNLVKNAIEALAGRGGRIDIANRGQINRDRKLYLELVVSDNGPGLPAEVLARLFAEVPSSKHGPNHGLGLAIVDSLVRQLGGQIACRSSRAGTSFEILLPAHASVAGAPGLRILGAA